jgi:hypothetical protein
MTRSTLFDLDRSVSHRARLLAPAGLAAAFLFRGALQPGGAQETQDAQALLTEAANNVAALETFAFALTTQNGETQFIEGITLQSVTGAVKRPDSFMAEAEVDLMLAKITIKMLSVGGRLWFTNPMSDSEEYQEIDLSGMGETDPTVLINPDRLILPALQTVVDPVIAGTESLDGVETTRIEGTVDLSQVVNGAATPEAGAALESDDSPFTLPASMPFAAWIDGEKLVRRVELTGTIIRGEASDIVRRVDLSAFNEPVDIQPPS